MKGSLRTAADSRAARIDESWGSLEWFASRRIGNAEGLTGGRVVIKKGMSNPKHSHPNCEEVLCLLSGRLEHLVGDDVVTVDAGDVLAVERGVAHCARSVGDEDAEMIVAYSSGERMFRPE